MVVLPRPITSHKALPKEATLELQPGVYAVLLATAKKTEAAAEAAAAAAEQQQQQQQQQRGSPPKKAGGAAQEPAHVPPKKAAAAQASSTFYDLAKPVPSRRTRASRFGAVGSDDAANCVFVPRRSREAERAMRAAGYDFVGKMGAGGSENDKGDVGVRCHRDAGQKARKLEARRGEEAYNAQGLDRKRCPTCQAFQSYKEHQEKRSKCQNCGVEYAGGLAWGACGAGFLGRMEAMMESKLEWAKEQKAAARRNPSRWAGGGRGGGRGRGRKHV